MSEYVDYDAPLLFQLKAVIDQAVRDHVEVARLRGENEKLKAEVSQLIDQGLADAKASTRSVLLAGLALSGEEGRSLAAKMIENELPALGPGDRLRIVDQGNQYQGRVVEIVKPGGIGGFWVRFVNDGPSEPFYLPDGWERISNEEASERVPRPVRG